MYLNYKSISNLKQVSTRYIKVAFKNATFSSDMILSYLRILPDQNILDTASI